MLSNEELGFYLYMEYMEKQEEQRELEEVKVKNQPFGVWEQPTTSQDQEKR